MNRALVLFNFIVFASLLAGQEPAAGPAAQKPVEPSTASASPSPAPPDSPLVAAAKRAKGGKIKPGTVISNENMKQFKGAGGSVTYANPADPGAPAYQPETAKAVGAERTREDWQKLMGGAREAIKAAEERVAEIRSREAKLANDFYAWDDPAYRDGVIKPAWDQARADLEAAKQSLETAKQRIVDLEEEARKSGALPGWLR